MHGYIIRAWRRYFRYSLAFETPLDGAEHYVMAEYPHGVFPLSQMLAATLPAAWPAGMRIYSIAADIVFAVPLWRQIMTWVGARPATAENFKALLGLGSVALVPGECFFCLCVRACARVVFVCLCVKKRRDDLPPHLT